MSDILFWNIILIELALGWFSYIWIYEILNIYYNVILYFNITFVCTIWLIHFGNESYILTYRKSDDEPNVYRIIKFPSIGR